MTPLVPVAKEPPANAGDKRDMGSITGLGGSPGGGHGNPLLYSCLENPHRQRSLVGCSPWCRKESDMTEQLSTGQHSTVTLLRHSYYDNKKNICKVKHSINDGVFKWLYFITIVMML